MEIQHTCSLGNLCHSSQFLKENNLKKCSYPFDWVFSTCGSIIHCIQNDFNIFLDKSYYVGGGHKKCIHSYYKDWGISYISFPHHNPLDDQNDYNYYVRCVNRFRDLLQQEEHKLFIMININLDNYHEDLKTKVIDFNNKFSEYTKNYTLLSIFHIKDKNKHHHEFTHHDNIDFLELHTLSESNGVRFGNYNDNVYLSNIIKSKYKFNLS